MKLIRFLVVLLMVVGSLNWGLVGFFQYDLISDLFGGISTMGARVLFALVGLAGLLGIGMLCRCCGHSCKGSCKCGSGCSNCGPDGCNCGSNCNCGPNCRCCHKKNH